MSNSGAEFAQFQATKRDQWERALSVLGVGALAACTPLKSARSQAIEGLRHLQTHTGIRALTAEEAREMVNLASVLYPTTFRRSFDAKKLQSKTFVIRTPQEEQLAYVRASVYNEYPDSPAVKDFLDDYPYLRGSMDKDLARAVDQLALGGLTGITEKGRVFLNLDTLNTTQAGENNLYARSVQYSSLTTSYDAQSSCDEGNPFLKLLTTITHEDSHLHASQTKKPLESELIDALRQRQDAINLKDSSGEVKEPFETAARLGFMIGLQGPRASEALLGNVEELIADFLGATVVWAAGFPYTTYNAPERSAASLAQFSREMSKTSMSTQDLFDIHNQDDIFGFMDRITFYPGASSSKALIAKRGIDYWIAKQAPANFPICRFRWDYSAN